LIEWLQYAEDHEEKVHIIGHHPPSSCMPSFSWNFYSIVNRLEIKTNLALALFEFVVYLDMKTPLPVNFMDIHISMDF
jgi:hypothetical protein